MTHAATFLQSFEKSGKDEMARPHKRLLGWAAFIQLMDDRTVLCACGRTFTQRSWNHRQCPRCKDNSPLPRIGKKKKR